ncbi:hypothetical protein B0H12DRAFT_1270696 [Mycena haematopus]|nr:hypothetical protein B0H12DRAFT_1270696 [Mycena haematopus]
MQRAFRVFYFNSTFLLAPWADDADSEGPRPASLLLRFYLLEPFKLITELTQSTTQTSQVFLRGMAFVSKIDPPSLICANWRVRAFVTYGTLYRFAHTTGRSILSTMNASCQDQEEYDLQRALLDGFVGPPHASTSSASFEGPDTSALLTKTKRAFDDPSDKQQRKRQKLAEKKSHNNALAETIQRFIKKAKPKLDMKYDKGALRLTRTPGRRHMANTVSLEDIYDGVYRTKIRCSSMH